MHLPRPILCHDCAASATWVHTCSMHTYVRPQAAFLPPTNLFDKFLLTSFATNEPPCNVTIEVIGIQNKIFLLAPLAVLFCTVYPPPADPGGVGAIRPCPPIRSVNGTWPPAVKDFYHTKMAHNLVSVYSVFFQPHSISESITINIIHIIDLVYTSIITSSDFSLASSLSMTYRTTSDHLLLFPLNYLNETKRLKEVEHQWHSESANLPQAPIFTC